MNYKKFLGVASAALMIVIAIFLLVPGATAASKFKTLHKFTGGKDGGYPDAALILDAAGNLYGTTRLGGDLNNCGDEGCGVVFELTHNSDGSWREHVLYQFTGGVDGSSPESSLTFDAIGNLYGTTRLGGMYKCGNVFKLTPDPDGSWKESVLHSFKNDGNDGLGSYSGVILDLAGNVYGTSTSGGIHDRGAVFQLTPTQDGSWTESLIYSFNSDRKDGETPGSGLIFDQAGNLYGTTMSGGIYGDYGTVFKLMPNPDGSWMESVLHSFRVKGSIGFFPESSLVFDGAGNLYGTAAAGGDIQCGDVGLGCGVAFELLPKADGRWTGKVLHIFNDKDGHAPRADLAFDAFGNLYGTTSDGGAYGYGVVFKLSIGSHGNWKEHVLHSFMSHPGANPHGGLIIDAAGNVYGTATGNGLTFGSIFEITP